MIGVLSFILYKKSFKQNKLELSRADFVYLIKSFIINQRVFKHEWCFLLSTWKRLDDNTKENKIFK